MNSRRCSLASRLAAAWARALSSGPGLVALLMVLAPLRVWRLRSVSLDS
jgi:hypothetical protein